MTNKKNKFPSPCGVLVLKFLASCDVTTARELFPSPCGVLVLKLGNLRRTHGGAERVSVPLRGSGS